MKRRAFTLVELLVVVAIIALLLSILLPALGRARAIAQSSVCLSSLKQVGLGIVYYAQDYNNHGLSSKDQLSFGHESDNRGNSPWFVQLFPYLNGPDLREWGNAPHQVVYKWLGTPDPNWDGLRKIPVYGCPHIQTEWLEKGFGGFTGYEMAYFFRAPEGTGYMGNGQLGKTWAWGSDDTANHPKIDEWTNPSSHIWILDGTRTAIGEAGWAAAGGFHTCVWPNKEADADTNGWFNGSSLGGFPDPVANGGSGAGGDPQRHGGKANYLFVDGHAETLGGEAAWYGIVGAR